MKSLFKVRNKFVYSDKKFARHSGACLESQLFWRQRQENHNFEVSLGNIARLCPKLKFINKKD